MLADVDQIIKVLLKFCKSRLQRSVKFSSDCSIFQTYHGTVTCKHHTVHALYTEHVSASLASCTLLTSPPKSLHLRHLSSRETINKSGCPTYSNFCRLSAPIKQPDCLVQDGYEIIHSPTKTGSGKLSPRILVMPEFNTCSLFVCVENLHSSNSAHINMLTHHSYMLFLSNFRHL